MRINTLVTLGASAAFGIMAIVLARGWINDAIQSEFSQKSSAQVVRPQPAFKTVPIIVADTALGFGDELLPQSLRIVDMIEDAVPEGAYSSFDSLFTDPTRKTVVLTRMAYNEPVLGFKISGPGGRGSLSALIADGMRATAIRVNDVAGVAGFVLPGDYVDVIFTRDNISRRAGDSLVSDVLLQNVRVLGIDQNLDDAATSPDVVKTVTVEVSNADAQRLHLAMDTGRLSLTLRQAGEQDITPSQTLTAKSIVFGRAQKLAVRTYKAPTKTIARAPLKSASQTAEITIIRGETRASVKVNREGTGKHDAPSAGELAGG